MQEVQQPMARLYHKLLGLSGAPIAVFLQSSAFSNAEPLFPAAEHSRMRILECSPATQGFDTMRNKYMCSAMKSWQHMFHHRIPNSCITQEYMHKSISQTILFFHHHFFYQLEDPAIFTNSLSLVQSLHLGANQLLSR